MERKEYTLALVRDMLIKSPELPADVLLEKAKAFIDKMNSEGLLLFPEEEKRKNKEAELERTNGWRMYPRTKPKINHHIRIFLANYESKKFNPNGQLFYYDGESITNKEDNSRTIIGERDSFNWCYENNWGNSW